LQHPHLRIARYTQHFVDTLVSYNPAHANLWRRRGTHFCSCPLAVGCVAGWIRPSFL